MRENESLIKVSVFAFHEKMGVLNFVQMNVHMYQNMKGYWKLGWGRSRGICSVCQTENWWEMSLNSGRKLWMRRGFSLVRASWCEDKDWKCWWRFTSRMLDKVRWKLRRGLNDRSECLKMMTFDMFEYENVMSMNVKMCKQWLPSRWWTQRQRWVIMNDMGYGHWLWAMALIMVRIMVLIWHMVLISDQWSWHMVLIMMLNMALVEFLRMSMKLTGDTKHDHDTDHEWHGSWYWFMIWSWYWSGPWAWHWCD